MVAACGNLLHAGDDEGSVPDRGDTRPVERGDAPLDGARQEQAGKKRRVTLTGVPSRATAVQRQEAADGLRCAHLVTAALDAQVAELDEVDEHGCGFRVELYMHPVPVLQHRDRRLPKDSMPAPKDMLPPLLAAIDPMLLEDGRPPWRDDPDTLYEIKYDGYRLLAQYSQAGVSLKTRNGANATRWFPEVVSALRGLPPVESAVLDGEVCVLDDIGRSDFDALHQRARARRWVAGQPPVAYCVFDLLYLNGLDLRGLPLRRRRELLKSVLPENGISILRVTGVEGEGDWLYGKAVQLQLEGIVCKRLDSTYLSGARSRDWLKRKVPGAVPAQRFARPKRDR